jgi:hypothetical protein
MTKSSFKEITLSEGFINETNEIKTRCFQAEIPSSQEDKVTVFCCEFNDIDSMTDNWEMLNSVIAVDYQSNLKSEFSRWNIYLLLWCDVPVTKTVKYKIENDRAFLRKIVFDNKKAPRTKESLAKFLDKVVLGADLLGSIKLNTIQEKDYQLSPTTQSLMSFMEKDVEELSGGNKNINSNMEEWSLNKVWLEIGLIGNKV